MHNPAVHRTLRDKAAQRPVTSTLELITKDKHEYEQTPRDSLNNPQFLGGLS